jgi:far upstream element-binding protein
LQYSTMSAVNLTEEDAAQKRTRDESLSEDATKKAKSDDGAVIIEVAPSKVGQIIGSRGAVISDVQNRSGAKVFVNQNFPEGVNRQVSITGTPAQVQIATDLINKIIAEGPTAIHLNSLAGGPTIEVTIDCAQTLVGRVIGSSGATIKELQSRSGAKIQIDQNFPDGAPRKITVTGTQTAVSTASELITYVMENGPNLPTASASSASPLTSIVGGPAMGANSHVMECTKSVVGRIIGSRGETINQLQSKSGARIQINQTVPEGTPCKIEITGAPQSVALAAHLVQEVINGNAGSALASVGSAGLGAGLGVGSYGLQAGGGGFNPAVYGGAGASLGLGQQFGANPYQSQSLYGGGNPYASLLGPAPPKLANTTWSEHKTETGDTYWYNSATGTSQWERPLGF